MNSITDISGREKQDAHSNCKAKRDRDEENSKKGTNAGDKIKFINFP